MIGLLDSLNKISKEGKTMAKYMQSIKSIVNDLTMIAHELNDEEITIHALNGLTSDFKELAAIIWAHDTMPTFEDLHDKLSNYETFLKRGDQKNVVHSITAQVA